MTKSRDKVPTQARNGEIDVFLKKLASAPALKPASERGRLMFALDATMSREPTWDQACHIQAEMFRETATIGGLEIQMVYFRGFGEFRATKWLADSTRLLKHMTRVYCLGGRTQIEKVLAHATAETKRKRVNALVYVGDCMEEDPDRLCALAGELGVLGVPAFVFHEGGEPMAKRTFLQIARLTKGAYCPFDASSARQLRELLSAVAVYAAGGRRALEDYSKKVGGVVLQIAHQVK
ncbi:MAG: VWA domain-containing protein [Alphaproteobacteria bacterium]|nr:VWA domain-containing protein [Alphaproteobacteria bacterium]